MKYLAPFILSLLLVPFLISAQTVHQELQETVRAEVLEIRSEETRDIIGTDADSIVQEVRVMILEGVRKGSVATFENDLMLVEVGDTMYVNRLASIDGIEYYSFKDADRRFPLVFLAALFVVVLITFAGFHGFRALLSLGLSIGAIFFVLVPLLLAGYSPVLVSVGVSGVVLALALFLTHGITPRSMIAFLGTCGAILITSGLSVIFVRMSHLTGLSSDAAIYLNFSTKGSLDFGALLLGSIIIGILGVLDDVSITQASVVRELRRANTTLTKSELYRGGIRVGRDHISSLVNTLSFAYIGVSLPLVLLLAAAESSIVLSLNQEMVAAELIRIFIGSIGLIIAVPITTYIAAWWYANHGVDGGEDEVHHTTHPH